MKTRRQALALTASLLAFAPSLTARAGEPEPAERAGSNSRAPRSTFPAYELDFYPKHLVDLWESAVSDEGGIMISGGPSYPLRNSSHAKSIQIATANHLIRQGWTWSSPTDGAPAKMPSRRKSLIFVYDSSDISTSDAVSYARAGYLVLMAVDTPENAVAADAVAAVTSLGVESQTLLSLLRATYVSELVLGHTITARSEVSVFTDGVVSRRETDLA